MDHHIKPFLNIGPGAFIKEELEARGWLQEDLAEIVGLSKKHVTGRRFRFRQGDLKDLFFDSLSRNCRGTCRTLCVSQRPESTAIPFSQESRQV